MNTSAPNGPASLGALLHADGCSMKPGMQEQMRQFLHAEITKWAKAIKTVGITTG